VEELIWCILELFDVAMMYLKGKSINDIIAEPEDGECSQ